MHAVLPAAARRDVIGEAVERLRAVTRLRVVVEPEPGADAARWLLVDLRSGSVWRDGQPPTLDAWHRVDA